MQGELKRPQLQTYGDIEDPGFLVAYDELLEAAREYNEQIQTLRYSFDLLQKKAANVQERFGKIKNYHRNFLTSSDAKLLSNESLRKIPYALLESRQYDAIKLIDLGEALYRGVVT